MAFSDEIRRRLEAAQAGLVSAREAIAKAKADEQRWTEECVIWERALAVELQREGGSVVLQGVGGTFSLTEPAASFIVSSVPIPENKTELARLIIAATGDNGMNADELQDAFAKRGYTLHRNYVFNIASRLKHQGKIEQRDGRYFATKAA
jgi:hypothetical protein